MSGELSSPSEAARALAQDHHRVDELIGWLRSAPDLPSLVSALEALSSVLVAHFAHEESPGGIYEVMGLTSPELRTPAGDLLDEHYAILNDLRILAAKGRERLARGHLDFEAQARALADRIATHESKEDALVRTAIGGVA
jgi:hypothetical protein